MTKSRNQAEQTQAEIKKYLNINIIKKRIKIIIAHNKMTKT